MATEICRLCGEICTTWDRVEEQEFNRDYFDAEEAKSFVLLRE